jgi:hypothetical protein
VEDAPMYQVVIDDNFHYADEDERITSGEFDTLEAAHDACRKIVEDSLAHLHRPGMTAEELYSYYTSFGDDPFVLVPAGEPRSTFSAWSYAKQRAPEMCAVPLPPIPDAPLTASST